jgi:hypothetical protein
MTRVQIDFLDGGRVSPTADAAPASAARDAGDLACWASLVCPGCGGVTTEAAHDLQHARWLGGLVRERTDQ